MSYDRLRHMIEECRNRLKEDYVKECSAHGLDEDGDRLRRVGATKLAVLNDVITDLKQKANEV